MFAYLKKNIYIDIYIYIYPGQDGNKWLFTLKSSQYTVKVKKFNFDGGGGGEGGVEGEVFCCCCN